MRNNKLIGNSGEKIAANYLKSKKYKIIAVNFKNKLGEIDIICENKEYIVFVEVKTRSDDSLASGVLAVNKTKQNHILKVANCFLSEFTSKKQPRFDIVEVNHNNKSDVYTVVEHIENAFSQGGDYAVF